MKLDTLRTALAQAGEEESRELFKDMMRRCVRLALFDAMEAEVESLCGRKHHPNPESDLYRAGSEKGVAYINQQKESISRPRVREKGGSEVALETYKAASSQMNLFEEVCEVMTEGLSSRSIKRTSKGAVSKSAASRMWIEKSQEQLEMFRSRSLSKYDFVSLQIDGIGLGSEIMLVVALGIDVTGRKHMLDFEQGTSESSEIVGSLLSRLHKRGVREPQHRRLLIQRDGSQAIAKGVRNYYPNALQQECWVHLQRNVKVKLRRKDSEELDLYFRRVREAQGKAAGEEAWDDLYGFVNDRNAVAAHDLLVRKEALLTFHRLDLPSTLNRTYLSTNIVENAIKNWRQHTGKVKLWNEKKDMVSRWAATGMLWSENTFNRIAYAEDLPHLVAALSSSVPAPVANAPSASTPEDKAELEEPTQLT